MKPANNLMTKKLPDQKKSLELLSPAKDVECGKTAINCGADALYIGAPKFGARAQAGNSLKDIEELVQYAHKYWARVYVTINTILYDNELEEVQTLLKYLYELGADAFIIQDMGILEMDLPTVALFASTQTHNYSIDRIKFLESTGFQRIILARELSLAQLKEIRTQTSVELEYFVHGALCVCFSGQCYFSYATTGRSANRGECSQPCRMLYSLEDSLGNTILKDKYLLSLKDLNLSSHLSELISSGITSFKIEGRLKDITYVKNITSLYRQKLDNIIEGRSELQKASGGRVVFDFKPDAFKTFNRGYTTYFLDGRADKIASFSTQKSTGEPIGKVKGVSREYFTIDSTKVFNNGDGICFVDKNAALCGTNINRVESGRIYPQDMSGLFPGAKIYRNHDHEFLKELRRDSTQRQIPVNFELNQTGEGLVITANDEDNNRAEVKFSETGTPADNPERMRSVIKKQLSKTGNSIFCAREITLNIKEIFFMTAGQLNELRRSLLEKLEEERIKNYPKMPSGFTKNETPSPAESLDYSANVVNRKSREFYERHKVTSIEEGFESGSREDKQIIMTCKYCIKRELDICPKDKPKSEKLVYQEPLSLRDNKRLYQLKFDCKRCEMSVLYLKPVLK